jgi:hypothetical protein
VPSMGWSMGGKMPFGMMIGGGCIHHHWPRCCFCTLLFVAPSTNRCRRFKRELLWYLY